jgi:hypothetical protein
MTGLQVMKHVKTFFKDMSASHPNLQEPVFYFQFAYLNYTIVNNLKQQGARGVYEKPIAADELKRILKNAETG